MHAVVQGVKNRTFGLLIGVIIQYKEMISSIDVSEDAIIVRKEIAEKMKREMGEVQMVGEEEPPTEIPGGKPIVAGKAMRKIMIRAKGSWENSLNWCEVFLHRLGAKVPRYLWKSTLKHSQTKE